MPVALHSPVPIFSPIPCLRMSLLSPVPDACILINVLASMLCAHWAKTPTWSTTPTIIDQGITPEGWKKGESADEKVNYADRLCQKCMSRNDNIILTELAWQAECHEIRWRTPWRHDPPHHLPTQYLTFILEDCNKQKTQPKVKNGVAYPRKRTINI